MKYDSGNDEYRNFIVTEDTLDNRFLGKCEAIMALGNGYMGIRSSTEESYIGEVRNTFVAGTFNKFDDNEVTELPNAPDVIGMTIKINGETIHLQQDKIKKYNRHLNLKKGELTRTVQYEMSDGNDYEFVFKRFVSLEDKHVIGQQITIIPQTSDAVIGIRSGINGQVTNSGVQHFTEGEKRLYENQYIQMVQRTTQSEIDFVIGTVHSFKVNNQEVTPSSLIAMDRRKIFNNYQISIKKGEKLSFEKISNIYTSRDKDNEELSLNELKNKSFEALKKAGEEGYDGLLARSTNKWQEIWDKHAITINSEDEFDQLAIRFAIYHLTIMTPAHDNRMNIGAKGFTGEGYKGHTFWDTEIFILPYFIYSAPQVARSLLEYRYNSLPGAHKKARENGYKGAMFPWESAWLDDGEVTPVWGAADIVTGESTKIWSGFIEQHITADIAFATWQYYQITKDEEFMDNYGYELFMDTAIFWCSRLEYNKEKDEYHINNVIGPDEYKEHVNNNAFTNYMASWNIRNAMNYYTYLKTEKPKIFSTLNDRLNLEEAYVRWNNKVGRIYLPKPNEDLIIAQDDAYLEKTNIDLTKYKQQDNVGQIFKDYNLEQVNDIQVSKQSDIMALFYLLENHFSKEIKVANWNYYEPKTLHDSSLSLSTHCVLANDLGDKEMAYHLFRRASRIDLGENMMTSDHGIHAASLGGIWQCVVNGFGGVRMLDGILRIEPHLPDNWTSFSFPLYWHGDRLFVKVTKNHLEIEKMTSKNKEIVFMNKGKKHVIKDKINIPLK